MPPPKRTNFVCSSCGKQAEHKAKNLCSACYQRFKLATKPPDPTKPRNRVRQLRVCERCGELRPYRGRGLCERCIQQDRTRKVAICTACGAEKPILARDVCAACYERLYRVRASGSCTVCGRFQSVLRKGETCFSCWYAPRAEARRSELRERWRTDPEYRDRLLAHTRQRLHGLVGSHTLEEWVERLEEYGHRCAYCLELLAEPTRDHITPVTWGPGVSDGIENIVPSCRSCNTRKSNRTPIFWLLGVPAERTYG